MCGMSRQDRAEFPVMTEPQKTMEGEYTTESFPYFILFIFFVQDIRGAFVTVLFILHKSLPSFKDTAVFHQTDGKIFSVKESESLRIAAFGQ